MQFKIMPVFTPQQPSSYPNPFAQEAGQWEGQRKEKKVTWDDTVKVTLFRSEFLI